MKKLTFLILIFTLTSCNYGRNGITAKIKNSSDKNIRNVIFSTDGNTKLEFDIIDSKESVEKFLGMTSNLKGDGAYVLSFERENGKKEQIVGGYHANGSPSDRKVEYEIKNDTILMKFSGTNY